MAVSTDLPADVGDLQEAYQAVASLKTDNATLRANFEELKELYVCLKENLRRQQEESCQAARDQECQIQVYQHEVESLQEQLTHKSQLLKETLNKLRNSHDQELAKTQAIQEVDSSYKARFDKLHKEVEASLHACGQQRQRIVQLEAALDKQARAHTSQMERMNTQHQLEVMDLKALLAHVRTERDSLCERAERVTALETQLQQQQSMYRSLQLELEGLREAKMAAVVGQQAAVADSNKAVEQAQMHERELEGLYSSAQRRITHLEDELRSSEREGEALHQELTRLQATHDSLLAQLTQVKRAYLEYQQQHVAGVRAMELRHEDAVRGLEAQVRQYESLATETRVRLEAEVGTLKQELHDALLAGRDSELRLLQQLKEAELELKDEKRQHEASVHQLEGQLVNAEARLAAGTEKTEHERKEAERLGQEVQRLQVSLRQAEVKLAEALEAATKLRAEVDVLRPQLEAAQKAQQEAVEKLRDADAEVSAVQRGLEVEQREHLHFMQRMKDSFALEKAVLGKKMKEELRGQQVRERQLRQAAQKKLQQKQEELERLQGRCKELTKLLNRASLLHTQDMTPVA